MSNYATHPVSIEVKTKRLSQSDMLSTDEAAALLGVSRVTVNAWIKTGRCFGVEQQKRGWRIPRWQFEPQVFALIQEISKEFDHQGWRILSFFETPLGALGGATPLHALITGAATHEFITKLAIAATY